MAEYSTQAAYEAACVTSIKGVFADRGLGMPSRVSLLRKYTDQGYLFFVAFVHFDGGLSATPAAARLRADLNEDRESRVSLDSGHYWIVRAYQARVPDAAHPSTLAEQVRLLPRPVPLPMPILQRQNGGNLNAPTQRFARWLAGQPEHTQAAYRDAVANGQTAIVYQYHQQGDRSPSPELSELLQA